MACRPKTEPALPVKGVMAAKFDKAVKGFPVDKRPKVRANQNIRRWFTGLRVAFNPQRVVGTKHCKVVGAGRKRQVLRDAAAIGVEVDGQKRGVVDNDSDFLDRGYEEIGIALALKDRGEEFHQGRPTDRRAEVVPGAVPRDADVDVAAKGRVPKMDRGRAFQSGGLGCGGKSIGSGLGHAQSVVWFRPGATVRRAAAVNDGHQILVRERISKILA